MDVEDITRYHKIPDFAMFEPVLLDEYLHCQDTLFEPHQHVKTLNDTISCSWAHQVTHGQLLVPTIACYIHSILDSARLFVQLDDTPLVYSPKQKPSIPIYSLNVDLGYVIRHACLDLQISKILAAVAPRNAAMLYYERLKDYIRIPKFTMRYINSQLIDQEELKIMWEKTLDSRKEDPKITLETLRTVLLKADSEPNHAMREKLLPIKCIPLPDLKQDGVLCGEGVSRQQFEKVKILDVYPASELVEEKEQ